MTPEMQTSSDKPEEGNNFGLGSDDYAALETALKDASLKAINHLTRDMHPADLAELLEGHSSEQRYLLVNALRHHFNPEVLSYLDEDVRAEIIEHLGMAKLAVALPGMDSDDVVELLEDLKKDQIEDVLAALPDEDRLIIEEGLSFKEGTAGRLMQREVVFVPTYWTIGTLLDSWREREDLPDDFYDVLVVDPKHKPVGSVLLSHIICAKREVRIEDLMNKSLKVIPDDMPEKEVAYLFQKYGLVAAPVVNQEGRLIGVITIDDVVDVMNELAEDTLMHLGGVSATQIHSSILNVIKSRFSWLFINLLTAILASMVIGVFDATIEKAVALAILMPIVASMGGNAGTQTLTVVVRSLATKDITSKNLWRIVRKELKVGLINGFIFALLMGAVGWYWFHSRQLGMALAFAMVANLFVAALAGVLVPLTLDRFKIDPAISSGVFVTTVTDVIGFFAFLGIASLFLF